MSNDLKLRLRRLTLLRALDVLNDVYRWEIIRSTKRDRRGGKEVEFVVVRKLPGRGRMIVVQRAVRRWRLRPGATSLVGLMSLLIASSTWALFIYCCRSWSNHFLPTAPHSVAMLNSFWFRASSVRLFLHSTSSSCNFLFTFLCPRYFILCVLVKIS